ncbi:type II toxin-antitoxin system RelB/DinJ family antitoxin [Neisseria chenwenguii]|uniref:Translation repressor RelB n=1 Tax=Neisseria chenwenguii TaxID=1853278 RepID=A0A220S2B7_9NEIS|nr:type II toxin-antitoxin system RelB/DinJ family antitoxin [Neisseria chenwenguii]ASK27508.1 translation repressor RelB [Neisseria chenwenguii]ROV55588.1 type II toxin-antitoxin system RelB/DinJ family antitoxin [Neisseria chenwenguii]
MASTNFNIRLEQSLKDRAFPVIESYGLTPAQAFKLFLNQVAETNTLPLSFDYRKNRLTPQAEARLRQSAEEMADGSFTESSFEEWIGQSKDA